MVKQTSVNLSQAHLNLLSICPPKFQQVYLDCLGSIPNPQQQESMAWGSRFHLLMQQRELNLPITSLLASDSELDAAFQALIQTAPELRETDTALWREAEHLRTIGYRNFVLTVIYDLLVVNTDRAIIFDWKTYRQPQKANQLAQNWQSRLYLYVLAETSEYSPEQIQMTYWFVRAGKPQKVTLNYDRAQHQNTERELDFLLSQLETWLQDYQESKVDFPHVANCPDRCPYSQSLLAETTAEQQQNWLQAIAEIEETPI